MRSVFYIKINILRTQFLGQDCKPSLTWEFYKKQSMQGKKTGTYINLGKANVMEVSQKGSWPLRPVGTILSGLFPQTLLPLSFEGDFFLFWTSCLYFYFQPCVPDVVFAMRYKSLHLGGLWTLTNLPLGTPKHAFTNVLDFLTVFLIFRPNVKDMNFPPSSSPPDSYL